MGSEYNLESKLKYCRIRLTDALPKLLKDRISNFQGRFDQSLYFWSLSNLKEEVVMLKQTGK